MFASFTRHDRIDARMPMTMPPRLAKASPRLTRACLTLIALVTIVGCSSTEESPYVERPVEQIYNEAYESALQGDFKKAAPLFDEVERQHPYSVWATQAQLMAAYSLYQANKYTEAVNALDRFIQLNPSNPNVDYAYYLKGLCYYEQIVDVGRDQKLTTDALASFEEVTRRFPTSKFARDARLKIDLTRNHLAGKEMSIGRWYLSGGQYLAAINRFQRVVEQYDTTDQVPEALLRLTEAYTALGLQDEAKRTASVLGHNYPGTVWYEDAYALATTGEARVEAAGSDGWFGWGLGPF